MTQQTPEEIFRRSVKKTIITPSDCGEYCDEITHHLNLMRNRISLISSQIPNPPEIHVFLVDDTRINATAFESHGLAFISVNFGLICTIIRVFQRAICEPGFFLEAGEVPNADSLPSLQGDLSDFSVVVSQPAAWIPINDPNRAAFCIHLIEIAIRFLADHEIAHILRGHCGYQNAQKGGLPFEESEWISFGYTTSLTTQALEFDADRDAVFQMLSHMIGNIEFEDFGEPFKSIYANQSFVLYFHLLSVYFLFRIFDRTLDTSTMEDKKHPPVPLRQRGLLASASEFLSNTEHPLFDDLKGIASKVLFDGERLVSQIRGKELDSEAVKTAFSDPKVMVHMRQIWKHRDEELLPLLERFSYVPLGTQNPE